MTMVKIFLIFGVFLLGLSKISLALTPTPTPTPQPNQDSYVLFYPIVAGKTEGESLYSLKLIRDRLVELLTFGNEKKSEVNLRLATKRLLEAEKLLKNNKIDLAKKAMDRFSSKLATSYDQATKAQESETFPDLVDQISQQTQKYQIVLNQLLIIAPESEKNFLQETIQKVTEIQNKVNQQLEE